MGLDNHLSRALINVIYFFIFFLLLVNYREEGEEKRNTEIFKILTILLSSSVIVGIIGLLQIFGKFIFPWDFTKINSFNTVGTTTSLGIFLAILLPVVLSLLLSIKQREGKLITIWFRIFLGVLAVLSLIVVLLLNVRVLWIITGVGMIVFIGFRLTRRDSLSSQDLGWLAIPIAILALCLIFLIFRPGVLFDLKLPGELGLTYKGGWSIAKEVIQRNPILGSGPETFVYNYSLYKPESINQTMFWNLRFVNAPAEILTLLPEIGVLGILSFLAIMVMFLLKVVRSLLNEERGSEQLIRIKIGLFSSWIALIVAWFLYPQSLALMFIFWLFLALLTVLSVQRNDIKTFHFKGSTKVALVGSFGAIILMIIVIGLLYMEGSKFIAEAKYKTALDLINKGELDEGIDRVVRATVANPYEDKFYRNLAQLFITQINQNLNNQSLDPQDRTNKVQVGISNAINYGAMATTLNSKNVANWIVRGFVYRNLIVLVNGSGGWAVKSYEEALKIEPANPFIYLEIGRTYVNGADLLQNQAQEDKQVKSQRDDYLNKAVDAYNKAIDLKSNYAPAHFELALVYERQGKTKEAITRMENSLILVPGDSGVAFQLGVLYYKDSQFDRAKLAFARAITLDPNFSNARYFLGLLFDRDGNKESAIEQFEKIAELNPDNESIKQILANLRAGQPALSAGGPPKQPEQIPIENQPEEIESPTQLPKSK